MMRTLKIRPANDLSLRRAILLVTAVALLAGPGWPTARADEPVATRTAYTNTTTFLSDLAALGVTPVHEGFESEVPWGAVRSTIVGGNHTAASITHLGVTWTANNANSQITTGSGAARSGSWGFYSLPHGDFANGIPDGFLASGDLLAAGGWFRTNTPYAGIVFIIDGDNAAPVDFNGANVLTTAHQFFGVIDTAGFTAVEFRESEGAGDDWKLMFADDFTFASNPCVTDADITNDGTVDYLDIQEIASRWHQSANCPDDQNGDGRIDIVDILKVAAQMAP